ncbi:SPW repeat protein [Alicyclobacillus dauci]|uniref:SPW repeat protein n=1 Tax=Alicyclobacillus dauci TaxID=1475485 RepID=A0ABY6YX15_9BACL|nr:SPW repeat protein [Alicyclobacillus dauci]WAH35115.1 SPW repeat protein [Alicyclobacillus dauci]
MLVQTYGRLVGHRMSLWVACATDVSSSTRKEAKRTMWQLWLTGLIGIWLIISPWIYNYASQAGALWNSIIFGVIVLILAIWAAVQFKNRS